MCVCVWKAPTRGTTGTASNKVWIARESTRGGEGSTHTELPPRNHFLFSFRRSGIWTLMFRDVGPQSRQSSVCLVSWFWCVLTRCHWLFKAWSHYPMLWCELHLCTAVFDKPLGWSNHEKDETDRDWGSHWCVNGLQARQTGGTAVGLRGWVKGWHDAKALRFSVSVGMFFSLLNSKSFYDKSNTARKLGGVIITRILQYNSKTMCLLSPFVSVLRCKDQSSEVQIKRSPRWKEQVSDGWERREVTRHTDHRDGTKWRLICPDDP